MTIYCSKKLETFLGQITMSPKTKENSIFGDWNGHLFTVDRKRCLIFMNNRTCYSIVFTNVQKKNLKDFGQIFKERLIRQLDHDIKLTEKQEINLRNDLGDIELTKSNNDKKIIGTINHHVENIKYHNYGDGVENWDELKVTEIINNYLVGTKIFPDRKRNRDFFRPIELMIELVK
jgi:hypothetical protein